MKFSLLYRTPETAERTEVFDLAYDLSLDRAVRKTVPDQRRADYLLGVLAKPLCDTADIEYRQQLMRDFIDNDGLLDELKTVFSRYDRVRSDWQQMRSGAYPQAGGVNRRALLEYTFASLKVTAMFPKTITSFFASFAEIIEKYDVKSDCLRSIREYCRSMLDSEMLSELERVSALFRYKTPADFEFSAMAELDTALRLTTADLCEITEIDDKPQNPIAKLFSRKKIGETAVFPIESDEATVDDALYIASEALRRIDSALTAVTGGIYDTFSGLSGEIVFYDAASDVISYLDEAGIDWSFPVLLPPEEDRFSFRTLRTFSLVTEDKTGKDIVPADISLPRESDGVIIRGRSNMGKTTLLRGVGIAHIMAQAGLPVTAAEAEISIRGGIYSHFSSAEEDFRAGDTAGRFEGEVQQIARIVDGVENHPHALILLNETFQTTSYSEGAEGIWQILDALPIVKAKYVFVTRMNKLFEIIDQERVEIIEMADGFVPELR